MCALKVLNKENVAAMKHVEHIINEREVLQYLADRRDEQCNVVRTDSQLAMIEENADVPECPFLMGIFSSF